LAGSSRTRASGTRFRAWAGINRRFMSARVWGGQADQHPHRGRLAHPVRASQRADLAGFHGEAELADGVSSTRRIVPSTPPRSPSSARSGRVGASRVPVPGPEAVSRPNRHPLARPRAGRRLASRAHGADPGLPACDPRDLRRGVPPTTAAPDRPDGPRLVSPAAGGAASRYSLASGPVSPS
jgi:hypothetical protein